MNPMPELAPMLKQLRLSGILDSLESRNKQAIDKKMAYPEFLALLISDEVAPGAHAVSSFWLMPRTGALRAVRPGLEVQILASDVPAGGTPSELATLFNDPSRGIDGVTASVVGGTLELRSDSTGSTASIFIPGGPTNQVGTTVFGGVAGTTVTGTEATAMATTARRWIPRKG